MFEISKINTDDRYLAVHCFASDYYYFGELSSEFKASIMKDNFCQ